MNGSSAPVKTKKMSDLIPALLHEANIAKSTGDYVRAEELFREILGIAPDNLQALSAMSLIAMDQSQMEMAITLLTKAVNVQPDNYQLLYNLGLAYQQANEIKAAIHYYKTAIEFNPDFSPAYNNLGIAYQHLGKIELANIYLEKAFLLNPNCIEAYYNFAQTHKFTQSDSALIRKIETLTQNKDLKPPLLAKLQFALGKAYDDLKSYDKAFEYYANANQAKFHGFDSQGLLNYIDRIIASYDKSLVHNLSSKIDAPGKRFIFIVGMPRSGTTLVEQIIASHPLVQSGGEIGFIGDVIDELPEIIHSSQSYPQCVTALTEQKVSKIAQRFNVYLDSIAGNFLNITDKSPINFMHLGLIKILFPHSQFIHVKRDPVATCLSCYFQNFEKQHQYSYNLQTMADFYRGYSRIMHHWEQLFGNELIEVSYEQLVNDPEHEMQRLVNSCGLTWDPACAEYYNANNVVTSASKWQTRQPIYRNSVAKWKNYEKHIAELLTLRNSAE